MKTTGEWIAVALGSGLIGGATENLFIGAGVCIVGTAILSVLDKIAALKKPTP